MVLYETFKAVKLASRKLALLDVDLINEILLAVADAAIAGKNAILEANLKDLYRMDISDPKYDRLKLTSSRIDDIASDIRNVSKLSSPLGNILYEDVRPNGLVLKKISAQLNNSTQLLAVRPDTLDYIYSRGIPKKVPVAVGGEVSAGRQYYVSDIRVIPDSVVVYAPQGVLNTILTAYTQPFHWTNVTDTLKKHINLQKLHGVKFVPSSVDVVACVDMYSEKTLEVPVVGIGFPKGKVLRTFPSKVQVTVQVGLKNFKSVTEKDFLVGVSYADVIGNKSEKLPLTIKKYPDVVSHVRVTPSSVDYLIEQQIVSEPSKEKESE